MKGFILGGATCGDNEGIGNGSMEYMLCQDWKSRYSYYWHGNLVEVSLTLHRWGWKDMPPWADQLAQGDYSRVTTQVRLHQNKSMLNIIGDIGRGSTH